MWSELISRPTPSILLALIGAAVILCLWALLSQRRVTRASTGNETAPRARVEVTPTPMVQKRPKPAPPAPERPLSPQVPVTPLQPTAAPFSSPAVAPLHAPAAQAEAVSAREVSGGVEIKMPQPVPCALAVAATQAAVEAKRTDAIRK